MSFELKIKWVNYEECNCPALNVTLLENGNELESETKHSITDIANKKCPVISCCFICNTTTDFNKIISLLEENKIHYYDVDKEFFFKDYGDLKTYVTDEENYLQLVSE